MAIPLETIINGILIFLRISAILFFIPIFGDNPTPVRVRVLLSVALTFYVYHIASINFNSLLLTDVWGISLLIFKELLIGFVIGILAKFVFEGFIMGANLVGYQMGFGVANLFMQNAEENLNGFSAFHRVIIMVIFLSLNLHYIFIKALVTTFEIIPLGGLQLNSQWGYFIVNTSAKIFVIALQLASPILIALMFTMAALGLIARTVPQVNVFLLSFPISFFVGLLVYFASLALYPDLIEYYVTDININIMKAIQGLMP